MAMKARRRAKSLAFAVAAALWSGAAAAKPLDCPLRDARFSIKTPFIDVLLAPAAKAAVEKTAPNFLPRLPAMFKVAQAPSFSAILSVEGAGFFARLSAEDLGKVDAALSDVAVTADDKKARCARYDDVRPIFEIGTRRPRVLLFEKINGFKDTPSVEAAHKAFSNIAQKNGWALAATDKGGAINAATLKQFDAIIWNNVSGDVLTLKQRRALQEYIKAGGGFVAVHGSAGDPYYFWDWYADELIGARFIGHPIAPQFQEARLRVDDGKSALVRGLPAEFLLKDEWYSFQNSPRKTGAHILLTLDEASYKPIGMGRDIHMGEDHPIAWTRCIGDGRSFYSALGHRPEIYVEPIYETLLERAVSWAAGAGETQCRAGAEIPVAR